MSFKRFRHPTDNETSSWGSVGTTVRARLRSKSRIFLTCCPLLSLAACKSSTAHSCVSSNFLRTSTHIGNTNCTSGFRAAQFKKTFRTILHKEEKRTEVSSSIVLSISGVWGTQHGSLCPKAVRTRKLALLHSSRISQRTSLRSSVHRNATNC